jgi:molybdopterin-guanine dinucleotide biosynthesis protein A
VVADPIQGFHGPLAGVLAGLEWVRDHAPGIERIATVSADAPFLPRDLVARLHAIKTELRVLSFNRWLKERKAERRANRRRRPAR